MYSVKITLSAYLEVKMKGVYLRKVTRDNWKKACTIEVKPEQQHFLGSVAYCLARAYADPYHQPIEPYVIYKDEEIIGFFWFTLTCDKATCILCGFRIDRNYQGLGLSKEALRAFIDLLKQEYIECVSVQLFVETDNTIAKRLYESFGFVPVLTNDASGLVLMKYILKYNVEVKLIDEDYLDDG